MVDHIALSKAVAPLDRRLRSLDNWGEWLPDMLLWATTGGEGGRSFTCAGLTELAMEWLPDETLDCWEMEQVEQLHDLVASSMCGMANTGVFCMLCPRPDEGLVMTKASTFDPCTQSRTCIAGTTEVIATE